MEMPKKKENTLKTSQVAENGRTAIPTSRSATAKDTMNKLVTLLNFEEQKTAAMTRQLPTMTSTLMMASTVRLANSEGSLHCTDSLSAAQALSFKELCIFDEVPYKSTTSRTRAMG